MFELLSVGAGGFIGAVARYGITRGMAPLAETFPLGTLVSNLIAGFVIGLIIGLEQQTAALPKKAKLFLTTGLLGGLSTFSAFSLETVELFRAEKYLQGGGNILLNVGLSLACVVLGMLAAKAITRALSI